MYYLRMLAQKSHKLWNCRPWEEFLKTFLLRLDASWGPVIGPGITIFTIKKVHIILNDCKGGGNKREKNTDRQEA